MRCEEVRPLISAGMDGELEGVRVAQVRVHLAECVLCAAERDALLETVRLLRSVPEVDPPVELRRRIGVALLEAERTAERRWLGLGLLVRPHAAGWGAGAAFGAVIATLALISSRVPAPPVEVAVVQRSAVDTSQQQRFASQRPSVKSRAVRYPVNQQVGSQKPSHSKVKPEAITTLTKRPTAASTVVVQVTGPPERLVVEKSSGTPPHGRFRRSQDVIRIGTPTRPSREAAPRRRTFPDHPEATADSSAQLSRSESTPLDHSGPPEPSEPRSSMAGMTQMASDPSSATPATVTDDLSALRRQLIDRPIQLPELGELKPASSSRSGRDGWIRF